MVNLKNLNLNFCTFFFFYKVKVSIGTSVTLKLEQGTSGDHEKLLFKIPKLKVITVNTTGIFCHYRAFLCVTSVRWTLLDLSAARPSKQWRVIRFMYTSVISCGYPSLISFVLYLCKQTEIGNSSTKVAGLDIGSTLTHTSVTVSHHQKGALHLVLYSTVGSSTQHCM